MSVPRHSRPRRFARLIAAASVGAACAIGARAQAADASDGAADAGLARKQACVDDFTAGQTLRAEHALRAARVKLVACAQEACPAAVRKDCGELLAQVDAALPTIVPRARDGAGHDLVDVAVRLDGEPVLAKLDGRALALDPGAHVVRFERAGADTVEVKIVVAEGEKLRNVDATFALPRRASTPTIAREGPPAGAWVLGGVAVVGLASFVYFGLDGRGDVLSLRESCGGACRQSDVDAAHRKLVVADVALGVTLISGGLATWLFLRDRPAERSAWVDVLPIAGGGVATIGGRF